MAQPDAAPDTAQPTDPDVLAALWVDALLDPCAERARSASTTAADTPAEVCAEAG